MIDLLAQSATVQDLDEACTRAIQTLARHSSEVLFAGVYLRDPPMGLRRVAATAGCPRFASSPLCAAMMAREPTLLEDRSAIMVPLPSLGEAPAVGVLILGLDSGIVGDGNLINFVNQASQQIGTAVALAGMQAQPEKHVQILELQDRALQTFFAIGLLARAALMVEPELMSESIAPALVQITDAATTGREQLREAMAALGEAGVGQTGAVLALKTLIHTFQERSGIEAELLVTGIAANLPAETVETLHYTAVQALANIQGHSGAHAVMVSLQITHRSVTLTVQDDGVDLVTPALDPIANSATQLRLRGIGLRVRRLGGTFVARPSRDGGFLVRTRLPVNAPVSAD